MRKPSAPPGSSKTVPGGLPFWRESRCTGGALALGPTQGRRQTHARRSAGHSFRTILDDLATIARNRVQPKLTGAPPFDLTTKPTKLQRQALDLLGVSL